MYNHENTVIVSGSNDNLNTLYQALALSNTKMEQRHKQLHLLEVAQGDRDELIQRIDHFAEQLGLKLSINRDNTPSPYMSGILDRQKRAIRHQGVRLHLPTQDELSQLDSGYPFQPDDYLQSTLVLGDGPGSGKTQTLLNGMVDAAVNPNIVLVVATEDEPENWAPLNPNGLYDHNQFSEAISWIKGQLAQRESWSPETQSRQKPIVFVIDTLNLMRYTSPAELKTILDGSSMGIYLYGSMDAKHLNGIDDASGIADSFSRVHRVKRMRMFPQ